MNQGSQTASLLLLLLPLVLIGFMLWSARRRQRTMAQFAASLQVGDEVFTTSGILGRIIELDDERARLEVAPGTVLTFDRRAIGMKVEAPTAGPTTEQGGQD
ncbi:preprotein translocase subunit YajC [Janibacter sp. Soil728]|uniref:preprotein translocase subunit YajC n=1 Tax=Janibacter sp. Soil728 TaxID=1736393 RepID=UPI0006FAEBBF|nr:preprotein translocase subunit YajC [Janibacter sp. Soil728]KRE37064.1 preprotein translocase subunit YajC [Janibacter sp. Soil728]